MKEIIKNIDENHIFEVCDTMKKKCIFSALMIYSNASAINLFGKQKRRKSIKQNADNYDKVCSPFFSSL